VGSAVISVILSSVFMDLAKGNLTYRAWLPFDYSSSAAFGIVYANQMIGMSTSALVNIACESLVCGLLLHICCQFDILEYRLTKVTRDQNVLPDCVRHHNYIFKSVLSSISFPALLRSNFSKREFLTVFLSIEAIEIIVSIAWDALYPLFLLLTSRLSKFQSQINLINLICHVYLR